MKKTIYSFLIIVSFQFANGQNKGLEKSIYTIQTGILGVWVNHECKLSNEISLRTEFGFDGGFRVGGFVVKTIYLLTPKISVEPR